MSKPTYRIEVSTTDVSIFYIEADDIDAAMEIALSNEVEPWRFNEGEPEVTYGVQSGVPSPADRRPTPTRGTYGRADA